jgi:hypothetical protein
VTFVRAVRRGADYRHGREEGAECELHGDFPAVSMGMPSTGDRGLVSIVPLPPGVVAAETRRRARTRDPDWPSCLCVPQDRKAHNLFLFIEVVRNSALSIASFPDGGLRPYIG